MRGAFAAIDPTLYRGGGVARGVVVVVEVLGDEGLEEGVLVVGGAPSLRGLLRLVDVAVRKG